MADYNPYGTGGGRFPWETAKTAKATKGTPTKPANNTTKLTGSRTGIENVTGQQRVSMAAGEAGRIYDLTTPQNQKSAAGRAAAIAAATKTAQTKTGVGTGVSSTINNFLALPQVTPKDSAIKKVLGTTGGATGGTSAGGATGGATDSRFTADMLYQDPSQVYQPLIDLYNQQKLDLQDRYGQNAADIKNIFGNLTTIRSADKAKIAQQFKTSIEQQQQALAARTAEARAGVAAGQQGAATAAGELGTAGQPAPTDSLTAQAAEQGIADANAYQTTWGNLQNVMSNQAQSDVQNAIQGYDYQQVAAMEALRNNLEDRLAAIQGNMAGTQSDLAQAQLTGKQNVLNAKYAEQQAKDAAAAKAANAAIAAAAKKPSYSKDMFGLQQQAEANGVPFNDIQSSINDAYASAYAALNPAGSTKKVSPKKADVLNAWNAINAGSPQRSAKLAPYVTAYAGYTYKN